MKTWAEPSPLSPIDGEGRGEGVPASLPTMLREDHINGIRFPHSPRPNLLPLWEKEPGGWVDSVFRVGFWRLGVRSLPSGGGGATSAEDRFQNTLEVISNLGIPKTRHQPVLLAEKLVSSLIYFAIQVLASIQPNPNPALIANKIRKGFFHIFLAAKLKAILTVSQSGPQHLLLGRLPTPEFAGELLQGHDFRGPTKPIKRSNPHALSALSPCGRGRGEG